MVNRAIIVADHAMGCAKEVIRLDLKTEIADCRGDREGPLSVLDRLSRIISRLDKVTTQIG